MEFPNALLHQLWAERSPFVILAYAIVATLVQRTPRVERSHTRVAASMLGLHLILAAVAAGQVAAGYDPHIVETISLGFELLAVVSIGMTAVFRLALPRVGLSLPRILIDLLTAVAVLVVLILVGRRAGFSVAGLITTSAVVTAVIGFSLQDTLGSVMGGLSLQLDKSVMVGDWITLGPGQPVGRVTEIRWRYTAIETRNWETVIIPNSQIVRTQVTVLGRRAGEVTQLRRHIEFFVDFRTSPTEVIDVVRAALREPVPRMAREPAAQVVFYGVRDSFGVYAVRYWLSDLEVDDGTDSDVRTRVWFALRRAGIPLSIPATTTFITVDDQARAHRKSSEDHADRMAVLASVDLFRALPDDARASLARQLAYMPFAAGEAITREGEMDEGLYMIVRGEASVQIGTGREAREVARLTAGRFFGEMSLMTGEARTASVIAATDLETYRVNKAAFQALIEATPAIAEQVADILIQRRTELTAARDHGTEEHRHERARNALVGRIRGFFGLERPND